MEPLNQNGDLFKNTCTTIVSSSCVKWPTNITLSNIELCKGDSMTDVVIKLTTALDEIKADIDISTLDYGCLGDCDTGCGLDCDPEVDLESVLSCIISDHCTLKDQVETLSAGSIFGAIDFDCIHVFSTTEKLAPSYTDEELINYLIQVICEVYNRNYASIVQNTNDITFIESELIRIEALIPTIDPDADNIPNISAGCLGLWADTINLDTAVEAIITDYGSAKNATFTTQTGTCVPFPLTEIDCLTDLNTRLTTLGWGGSAITDIDNLEDRIKGLYDALCTITSRMEDVYDQTAKCCVKTCSDVDTDLFITKTGANYILTLTFDGLVTLPAYIDSCGTNLTITITDGTVPVPYSVNTTVSLTTLMGGSGFAIPASVLANVNFATDVTFELSGCFKLIDPLGPTDIGECFLCESALLPATSAAEDCEVCTYELSGLVGTAYNVEVVYQLVGSNDIEVIIVTTDTFTLPASATIISVTNLDEDESGFTITSETCPDIATTITIEDIACYEFIINGDLHRPGGNPGRYWDITGFKMGDDPIVPMPLQGIGPGISTSLIQYENFVAVWYAVPEDGVNNPTLCPGYALVNTVQAGFNDAASPTPGGAGPSATVADFGALKTVLDGVDTVTAVSTCTSDDTDWAVKIIIKAPAGRDIFLILDPTTGVNESDNSSSMWLRGNNKGQCDCCETI